MVESDVTWAAVLDNGDVCKSEDFQSPIMLSFGNLRRKLEATGQKIVKYAFQVQGRQFVIGEDSNVRRVIFPSKRANQAKDMEGNIIKDDRFHGCNITIPGKQLNVELFVDEKDGSVYLNFKELI